MERRRLRFLALTLACALAAPAVLAQDFPTKSVRWVVGYAAGGGSDFVARTIAQVWQEQIGQSIVVDNKPGANTSIAAADVSHSAADGYTVGFVDNSTMVLNPMLYKKLPYDPNKEFRGITLIGRMPGILVVNPAWGVNSVKEYVQRAKDKPGSITFGSPGAGNVFHLGMELFNSTAGISTVHVPYKGAAPALADLAAGHIQVMMVDLAASMPFIKGGRIKPIAVANPTRLPSLPDVPTLSELGYAGFEAAALQGVVVPVATPPNVVATLNRTVVASIKSPTVSKKLSDYGIEPVGSTAQEFASVLAADRTRWQKVITDLKISLD